MNLFLFFSLPHSFFLSVFFFVVEWEAPKFSSFTLETFFFCILDHKLWDFAYMTKQIIFSVCRASSSHPAGFRTPTLSASWPKFISFSIFIGELQREGIGKRNLWGRWRLA